MFNKKILFIIFLLAQISRAALPVPSVLTPNLPIFSDFEPQIIQQFYNWVASQPDFSREQRVINEIEDAVLDGDVEYLPLANGKAVFSIYMESETDKPKGGVIILHNRGQHANWNDTIKPLRVGLSEKGWDTLSVQMPILNKQAKYYDYVPLFPYAHQRIKAAIDFYKQRGVKNIVVIAHGCGAHMLMSYLDEYGDNEISRIVGIGMGATDYKQKLIKPYPLEKITVPILDIFAQNDFTGVLRLAKIRKPRLNSKSTQMSVKGASHYYQEEGVAENLIEKIDTWLSQND